MPQTVYILEDESITRDLCVEYVQVALPEFELAGSSADGNQALEDCLRMEPDLVIIDIRLPGMSGLEFLQKYKKHVPSSKVLIYSGTDCSEVVKSAWVGNADGFVEKRSGMQQIKAAVDSIMNGRPYFSESVAGKIIDLSTSRRIPGG